MQPGSKTIISASEGRTLQLLTVNEKESKSEDCFFFNSNQFVMSRELIGESGWLQLYDNAGSIKGMLFLSIDGKQAWSHQNTPFGSLERIGKLSKNDCEFFISGLLSLLNKKGVETLNVTHYPFFYDLKTSEWVDDAYQSMGFKVDVVNINQYLMIDQVEFRHKLTDAKRNRLNKWYRTGFDASQNGIEDLPEAYKLILESRERKEFDISMSLREIQSMFLAHPDNYFLFTVRHQEKLIAAAITIKVNSDILYTYAYADEKDYLAHSPTLLVLEQVYEFGRIHGFCFVDLGTSSPGGVLNEGVHQFKKESGALESVKKEYVWNK